MYVVARDLTGHDLQFVFCGNLPQQVAHTNCYNRIDDFWLNAVLQRRRFDTPRGNPVAESEMGCQNRSVASKVTLVPLEPPRARRTACGAACNAKRRGEM